MLVGYITHSLEDELAAEQSVECNDVEVRFEMWDSLEPGLMTPRRARILQSQHDQAGCRQSHSSIVDCMDVTLCLEYRTLSESE